MTIRSKVELIVRRRNVEQFIREDSTSVQFSRRSKVPTPAGGWKWGDPEITPPQIVRIIPAKRRYGDTEVNTEAGQVPIWPYILLGKWDMDITEEDVFWHQGEQYVVKDIEQDREERTQAFVDYYGAN